MKLPIKILFLIFALQNSYLLKAQTDEDTIPPKTKVWKIETPQALADTVWNALIQKTDEQFLSLIPTVESLKETFDSLEIKNNPQIIKIKHNYISFRLKKQYKSLKIHARKNDIKLKQSKLNEVKAVEGKDDKGVIYAYITLNCSKSKKEFLIKFVALKLYNYWYIADQLKMEMKEENPYYKPQLKKEKK
ncbi:MAG: hypothetical protein HUU47_10035 [Bacteroidetes bacterium]|nr:hypothetical protein [Bacteroidota bacterium]